jgi:preprotein translocase SecY subunit
MLEAVINAFKIPDIRRKVLFTIAMLVIFRILASIPVPGVNQDELQDFVEGNQLLSVLNLFSGAGLSNFSIVALGVYPYITASIIMQLMTPIIPRLNELSMEGQQGRNKINQYTHWLTVPLAFLQAYGHAILFTNSPGTGGVQLLEGFGLFNSDTFVSSLAILLSMTAGTLLLTWMGELITEMGIGNGTSIIIFGGIVANLPSTIGRLFGDSTSRDIIAIATFAAIALVTVVGIVLINEGQRRIPVQHAKRIRGNRMYGGTTTFIPLRVNSAGMIPLIFAVSIMVFPGMIANFLQASSRENVLQPEQLPVQPAVLPDGGGLHLLLHDGGVPAATYPGEPAAARSLHSGRTARTSDRDLPATRAQPDHDRRCALPRSGRHLALLRGATDRHQHAVVERDIIAHRGRRGDRHHAPARSAAHDAQLRRFHQLVGSRYWFGLVSM